MILDMFENMHTGSNSRNWLKFCIIDLASCLFGALSPGFTASSVLCSAFNLQFSLGNQFQVDFRSTKSNQEILSWGSPASLGGKRG